MSFIKRSLETKIIMVLGLVLTALLGLSFTIDVWSYRDKTYQVVFKELDVLANTIQKSLIKDMREGSGTDVQRILEMVGTERGILAVRIFDENGRILKSTDRFEIGHAVPQPILANYKLGRVEFVSGENKSKAIHIIHTISNAPPCYGCHGKEQEVNGVLSLDYSLAGIEENISSHMASMAALGFITIFFTGMVIYLLLKKIVNDPLTVLKSAMADAEKGNLDIAVAIGPEDEIGSLRRSFNNMLARIKDLNEQTVLQQRDLARKEQELQLQQVLARQNMALEAANNVISEKNRYYMEMLSFVSHELKSPLVVLTGYSNLLLKGDLGELSPPQREALAAMERNVGTLQEMLANYLDLSRLERGELKPEIRRVDLLEDVIRPVMAGYADILEKASMSIRIETADTSIKLEADPSLLKSAFGNLVSNAVKYGFQGSDVLVEVEKSPGGVRLSVFNEGQGIPYGDLEKIFGRFSRLDNEGTRAQKGTGLGLYIVKEIVEMHGGKVWAESKEGSWAKVSFNLPAVKEGA